MHITFQLESIPTANNYGWADRAEGVATCIRHVRCKWNRFHGNSAAPAVLNGNQIDRWDFHFIFLFKDTVKSEL